MKLCACWEPCDVPGGCEVTVPWVRAATRVLQNCCVFAVMQCAEVWGAQDCSTPCMRMSAWLCCRSEVLMEPHCRGSQQWGQGVRMPAEHSCGGGAEGSTAGALCVVEPRGSWQWWKSPRLHQAVPEWQSCSSGHPHCRALAGVVPEGAVDAVRLCSRARCRGDTSPSIALCSHGPHAGS